ncbi:organic solute transporter subunit beta [Stigmatopora nigra]
MGLADMFWGCLLLFLFLSGPARASTDDEPDEEGRPRVTEEEKEYLRWLYRTEDATVWKFALLGLAFVCLLVGFLLLGMGAMASRNRRKIAKYKAAAAVKGRDEGNPEMAVCVDAQTCNGDDSKAGSIVVTWKDGNTSCLYADTPTEADEGEESPVPPDEYKDEEGGDSKM